MASVSFFIRSNTKVGKIFIRFRHTGIDIRIATLKSIHPDDWSNKKAKAKSRFHEVNTYLNNLEVQILNEFNKDLNVNDWKKWLYDIINSTKNKEEKYPDDLDEFIPVYIDIKKNTVTQSTIAKCKVIRNMMKRYCDYQNIKTIKFSDLDNNFFLKFEEFSIKKENYSISYTYKNLKFIKMIAKVAQKLGVQVHQSIANWSFSSHKIDANKPRPIFLSFEELDAIENFKQPTDSLENIKDWLLISCYTAQRISDFSRFDQHKIVQDNGIEYIEFKQKKTNNSMRIPLIEKVKKILEKRNRNFPYKISDQKFNLYVKIVVKNVGITQMIDGGKIINKRKVFGKYPKYELISSHVGRRSFATNFYNKLPTSILITATGHKSEKQLLTYIGKSEREKSEILAKELIKLGY